MDEPLLCSECTGDSLHICVHRWRWWCITERRRVSENGLFCHELMKPSRNSFLYGVSGRLHPLEWSASHPSSPDSEPSPRLPLFVFAHPIMTLRSSIAHCTSPTRRKDPSLDGASTSTSPDYLGNVDESIQSRSRELLGACIESWCSLDYLI